MTLFFSCASLDAVLREYRRGRAAKTRSCAEYHKMAGISSRFTFIATHRSASSVSLRRPFVVRKIFLFVSFGFVFLRAQPSRSDPSRKSVSLNIPLRGKRRARFLCNRIKIKCPFDDEINSRFGLIQWRFAQLVNRKSIEKYRKVAIWLWSSAFERLLIRKSQHMIRKYAIINHMYPRAAA